MRGLAGQIWRDPTLRMVAGGALLFGTFGASLGVHQSLIAVRVFGLSDPEYALLLFLAMIVSVASSVTIGIVSDRGPWRKATSLLAAGAGILGPVLIWLTGHPLAFVICHAVLIPVAGTMFGQLFAVARLATNRYAEAEQDSILGFLRAFFAVPYMLGLPIWAFALREDVPLLTIYPVVGSVSAVLLLLILFAWPHDSCAPWGERKSGLGFSAALREMASGPVVLRVVLMGAVHTGGALSGIILGLLFARTGREAGDVGLFFGLFVAIEIAATLLVARLVHQFPRLWLIAAGVAAYSLYLALLPFLASTAWLWVLVIPAGAGGGFIYTLAITYLQTLLHERPGAGASLIAIQRVASEGLTTAVYGFGAWIQGYATVSILGGLLALMAIGTLLQLDRALISSRASPIPPGGACSRP